MTEEEIDALINQFKLRELGEPSPAELAKIEAQLAALEGDDV